MGYKYNPFTGKLDNVSSGGSENDPVFTAWNKSYSDLINKPTLGTASTKDSGFFASALGIDDNYVTDVEKSNLHAPKSDDQTLPTLLSDLLDDSTHRLVTDTEKSTWNNKSNFSGSYNDLTNKPTIPVVDDTAYNATSWNENTDAPTKNAIRDKLETMGGGVSLLDVYPVGAIYISVVSTSPATLFGGTWSAFGAGKVLVGIDAGQTEFDTIEETGGAKTHTHTDHPALVHTESTATKTFDETGADGFYIDHPAQSHNSPSHLPPYIVVYMWKRTA